MNKHKLTASNYFSPENQRKYMGVSQFKSFEKCQAAAMAEINEEYFPPMTTLIFLPPILSAQ